MSERTAQHGFMASWQHGFMAACNAWHMLQPVSSYHLHVQQHLPKYLWSVGGSHKQHPPFSAVGVAAFHLHEHLCLQPPAGLMLTCITTPIVESCSQVFMPASGAWLQLHICFTSVSGIHAACHGKRPCCMHRVTMLACTQFYGYALFGAIKSRPCTYLAHDEPESINNTIIIIKAVHVGFGDQQKI